MLIFKVDCDICGEDNIYSNLAESKKDFNIVRLHGHNLHICKKCKNKYGRSAVYKILTAKYPSIRKRNNNVRTDVDNKAPGGAKGKMA